MWPQRRKKSSTISTFLPQTLMSLFLPSPHPSGSSKDNPMVSSFPPVDAPPNVDVLEMGVWRAFRARTSNEDMSFVRAFSTYVVSVRLTCFYKTKDNTHTVSTSS